MKKEFKLVSKDYNLGFAKLHYRGWIGFFLFCVLYWLVEPLHIGVVSFLPEVLSEKTTIYSAMVLPLFEVVLLLKNGVWERNGRTWQCVYGWSWNWLLVWTLLFWPVAIILFVLRNPSWVGEDRLLDEWLKKQSDQSTPNRDI